MKTFGGTGEIKSGASDIYLEAKAPACNFFQNNDQQTFWGQLALHATQHLLTDCPDRLTRFSVQYRPSKKCKI